MPRKFSELLTGFTYKLKVGTHRGSGRLSKNVPENTFKAFEYGLKKGAKLNELDIRITKDKVPIVFHGPRLEITTSGYGKVESKNFSLLEDLDWGFYLRKVSLSSPDGKKKDQNDPQPIEKQDSRTEILSLEEYLTVFGKKSYHNLELKRNFFDLKHGLERETARLVRALKLEDRVFFSSFHLLSLLRIKKALPECGLGLLFRSNWFSILTMSFSIFLIKPDSIHIHASRWDESMIKKWSKKGYTLLTWGENSEKRLMTLFKWGIHIALIDDPTLIRRFN